MTMQHRTEIEEHVVEVICGDASLIIDIIGRETIEDLVSEFGDDDLRYYFESGYTGYNCVEDLIDEINAEQRR